MISYIQPGSMQLRILNTEAFIWLGPLQHIECLCSTNRHYTAVSSYWTHTSWLKALTASMLSRLCFVVTFSGKIRSTSGTVLQQAAPTCPPLAADRQRTRSESARCSRCRMGLRGCCCDERPLDSAGRTHDHPERNHMHFNLHTVWLYNNINAISYFYRH